ncbi:hypothetical protein, partial [Photobacterium sp. 1_MG-2023]|uniref:hypothetical protein n=1 Tax=Photobacterium sp. 1_MG-2023 TaxID=3062646 RepID=UPI0026E48A55
TTWKALVAAKAWVSLYPNSWVIIHTNNLRVIQHAWHFWFGFSSEFTEVKLSAVGACFTP